MYVYAVKHMGAKAVLLFLLSLLLLVLIFCIVLLFSIFQYYYAE